MIDAPPPRRPTLEVLDSLLPVTGLRVADIGCGDGALVRALAERGARAVGVEIALDALARARATPGAGAAYYLVALGEALPFADGALDAAVFFNSLHHVPVDRQAAALAEAARVLAPGGRLLVAEPLAEGPLFDLVRAIDDETEVRAAATRALAAAGEHGLRPVERVHYLNAVRFADFEAFRTRMVSVDPGRAADFDRQSGDLARRFEALGLPDGEGRAFDQPMRVDLMVRAAG
ncbi:MAG: methyltransferase domain-containing protein [Azospirillaceae bacterium]